MRRTAVLHEAVKVREITDNLGFRYHYFNFPCHGQLPFHKLDSMQNIIQRPPGPARDNLRPYLFRNGIVGIQKAPVWTGLRFDPLEIFNLTPAVFMVRTVVVQGLEQWVSRTICANCWYALHRLWVSDQIGC